MAYRGLREFLDRLEEAGDLHRVRVEVDPLLEVAAITDRQSKAPGGGKALLFERVSGSRFPVATNLLGSYRRVCTALKVEELTELTARVTELLASVSGGSSGDTISALLGSRAFARFAPQPVTRGACQEVVEDVPDLAALPALKSWPGDGEPGYDGRFITLPLVCTRDPETGRANCGIYLAQLLSRDTIGVRWRAGSGAAGHWQKYRDRGERMPVAIALGGDPALLFAAAAPLPGAIDEMQFAGFLRNEPVEMVCCRTSDIMGPADAELVIEGEVDPRVTRSGGAFGNHTGFYLPPEELPVMRVTCITRRRTPVFPATVVGPPPMEDCYLAKGVERLMLPFLRLDLPEIVEINLPLEGIFHGAAVVSIDKRQPGQARRVMEALWSGGWLSGSRLLVVVDADLDPHDLSRVYWKVLNSTEWRRDVVMYDAAGGRLAQVSSLPCGGRLGIDATRKLPEELAAEWPREIAMDEAVRKLVEKRWREYGFGE
ncbi:MAG TPA: UbiD family decarboxylase [Geobacteraceae bacterium]|nr:UbiD family decarboxylase [Geobacteraceae bacterium]